MVQSASDSKPMQDALIGGYQKLSSVEQSIVQLFSVIYVPVSRAHFFECLQHESLEDEPIRSLTYAELNGYVDELLSMGLLVQMSGKGPQCHPLLAEIATREAVKAERFSKMAIAVQAILPTPRRRGKTSPRYYQNRQQFLRDARLGLYGNDVQCVNDIFEDHYTHNYGSTFSISTEDIALEVFNAPFDPEWIEKLPLSWYNDVLSSILACSDVDLIPADDAYHYLHQQCLGNDPSSNKEGRCSNHLRFVLAQHLICRGQFQQAEAVLNRVSNNGQDAAASFWGWLSFLKGDIEGAIAHYTLALTAYRKARRKKKAYFNTAGGLFFILALLKEGSENRLLEARAYSEFMAAQEGHWLQDTYEILNHMVRVRQGDATQADLITIKAQLGVIPGDYHSFEHLISALCLYWVQPKTAAKALPKQLTSVYHQAKAAGLDWLAMEFAALLTRTPDSAAYRQESADFFKAHALTPLADLIRSIEPWELSLKALANLTKDPATQSASVTLDDKRLAWMVTVYGQNNWMLQPREQKITKSGKWGKGRNIALKRLYDERGQFDYFTPQDLKILAHLNAYRSQGYYYGTVEYTFDPQAMVALIGHPLVFWEDNPTVRIDVVKGDPELLVEDQGNGFLTIRFSLTPSSSSQTLSLTKESPTRLKVTEMTEDYRRIANILGTSNALQVPIEAKDQVLAAINSVASLVTVHSDIGGGMASVEEVPADATPHIHLLPAGEGLSVSMLCRPFSNAGPYYAPGSGGRNVIAEIEGQRLQTNRNLQQEKDLAQAVISRCSPLARLGPDETEWLLEDPEDCLELLVDLQDVSDLAVVEWPEGETMRVRHQAGFGNFHMNIRQQQDWFAATGELKLDDDHVLGMRQLMTLLEQTPSRFIPLGDGQFIALTHEFRKRMDEMRTFAERHGDGLRFHPLASLAMEDMMENVEHLKVDKHWKANVKKIRDMEAFQPQLPSTFQAELRDYQHEGFEWLARLAYWGVGACLADDMGLGKTIQALSVILTRAPQGPTLIVAPTSVGMNWIAEAQKFAPTLNPVQFGSGDRQTLLDSLSAFDMLVCSYGLLQQDDVADMLAKIEWQTIVLDEAQAIKNAATKRSKAAMSLKGGFKVLTTGTPIENHLGELWNLFRFINPGLLGSMDRFNQQFAYPIERDDNKQARTRLKKLISPFILRRTKSQVLEELPSRTEVTLHVELSKDEMAMYEALRREAIDRLSDSTAEGGAKHLQVLAEIMKLRRMCCNPKLILPETDLMGSKLQVFGETLDELLANRHKVLVFSQFVDHLTILKAYLEEQNIHFQYLDGSTPAKVRKQRVDAFQSGDGDVFLISLKAGGTGLNLTAADYVIHMDPWWNPAVEDQASDRAHRIGQKRPVTIYRLVTKHTIEEKIVALHAQKRDLADSLLEGTDMSGKISTDDLIQLMSEM
ncbi:MAG: SNF2-related protein [Leptolyngbyaceae bacterium]|nr:SNF2-related protein [Leptolyngbyaceae bacterium]